MVAACKGWRNAVDLHHWPGGTHSLAPRPGSLVRLTFQIGPRGRTCTCTIEGLSFAPLHWATRAMRLVPTTGFAPPSLRWTTRANWCRVRDFHPQPLRSERSVSCRWTNAAKIVNRKSQIVNAIGTPGRTLTLISD